MGAVAKQDDGGDVLVSSMRCSSWTVQTCFSTSTAFDESMGLSTKEMDLGSGLEKKGNLTRTARKHSAQLEAEMSPLLF